MLSNSGVILALVFTLRSFFQRERYIIWNYKTIVTALMSYQFSVLSEGQNVNPTLDEDSLKSAQREFSFLFTDPAFFFSAVFCTVMSNINPIQQVKD